MGLKGFYPWLRKKRGHNPRCRNPNHVRLPEDSKMRIDVASFFTVIRSTYSKNTKDKTKAHQALLGHISRFGGKSRMVFYVGGAAAVEKKETHMRREDRRVKSSQKASTAIKVLKDRVSCGKAPTNRQFKDATKALNGAFNNDYNSNVKSLGVVSNYKIIQSLAERDVQSIVRAYLNSTQVVGINKEHIDFPKSVMVFVFKRQGRAESLPVPLESSMLPATTSPPSEPASVLPFPSLQVSFETLQQQYQVVIDEMNVLREQRRQCAPMEKRASPSDCKPNRQGKDREFRRHRTIDKPAYQPGVSQKVHRPRYSPKARPEPQQHDPPQLCKLYKWKPYTTTQEARYRQSIDEAIGTVNANCKREASAAADSVGRSISFEQQEQQYQEVSACMLDIVSQVRLTKRHVQEFLESFIETIFKQGLTTDDRVILSFLCPAVESKVNDDASPSSKSTDKALAKNEGENDNNEDSSDNGDIDSEPSDADKPFIAFYKILMAYIYSRKMKSKTVAEKKVGRLLARAAALGVALPPVLPRAKSYPTNELLESTTNQLYRSIKSIYRNGSIALEKKLNTKENTGADNEKKDGEMSKEKEDRGTVKKDDGDTVDMDSGTSEKNENGDAVEEPLRIDSSLPAIENFLVLNQSSGGTRKIAPLSPLTSRYVGFSERQSLPLFWHWPTLKIKIRHMMAEDHWFQKPTIVPALADAMNWLTTIAPGRIITTFVSDVGLPASNRDRGFRKSTVVMDIDSKNGEEGLRGHLNRLRSESFDPREWTGNGYIHKGAILTDGHLLELHAFKVKELQSVRYRRFPDGKLPNSLTSVTGGASNFLMNVFGTDADVKDLLDADLNEIAILSLDLGTSCVVGASVSLPPGQTPATIWRPAGKEGDRKKKRTRRSKRKASYRKQQKERRKMAKEPRVISTS
ncbi:hypothetical protein BGZ80_005807 [Entomortierella chlamydospora]|uniref:Uncharacterized protein n=1 Tax=Entomortierella chlamydospora TaxID=101097 RepID=A0A9P6N0F9_9FUNG|nr:hypothetical protein BGZ80_005807 [Entomortierella chlamydospora]